jgi:hypothetical protein
MTQNPVIHAAFFVPSCLGGSLQSPVQRSAFDVGRSTFGSPSAHSPIPRSPLCALRDPSAGRGAGDAGIGMRPHRNKATSEHGHQGTKSPRHQAWLPKGLSSCLRALVALPCLPFRIRLPAFGIRPQSHQDTKHGDVSDFLGAFVPWWLSPVPRSPSPVQRSAFDVGRSTFGSPSAHSPIPRSPLRALRDPSAGLRAGDAGIGMRPHRNTATKAPRHQERLHKGLSSCLRALVALPCPPFPVQRSSFDVGCSTFGSPSPVPRLLSPCSMFDVQCSMFVLPSVDSPIPPLRPLRA